MTNDISNIYESGLLNFDQKKFILDYFSIGWEDLMKVDELNADNSASMDLDKIIMILKTYTPFKRINKYKLKIKSKP